MAYHLDEQEVSVGNLAPDFEAHTASGSIQYHHWVEDAWSIIFSHPGTSFPLELLELAKQYPEFSKRNIKVIGVSSSWLNDQRKWKASQVRYGIKPGSIDRHIQIVADDSGEIAEVYRMHAEEGNEEPNTVFVVDPNRVVRIVLGYPATFRKNVDKLVLFIDRYSNASAKSREASPALEPSSLSRSRTYTPETRPYKTSTSAPTSKPPSPAANSNSNTFARSASNTFSTQTVVGLSTATTNLSLHPPSPDASSSGNYIQNALNVLESLVDVGRVIPFVAPAFVLLKVIIEVEKSAQESSEKCRDLVERVTFMLGFLPTLRTLALKDSPETTKRHNNTENDDDEKEEKPLTISHATRIVIDRMNNILKDCAALIEAYRKQGIIARRLSLKNKEKFETCANALADVTNDLMLSLQIYQTAQLDRMSQARMEGMKRPVVKDAGEDEAEEFLGRYGGEEAVKNDPELVRMFVEECSKNLHLEVKPEDLAPVMTDLQTNLTSVIRQNTIDLESRIHTAVLASILTKQDADREAEKEQTLVCVQCDKEFKQSSNGESSCSFHKAEYDSWNKTYPCCATPKNPCQVNSHKAKHHCEYPYSTFFPYGRNVWGYSDTVDTWVEVEDVNLESEDDDKVSAEAGELLRWKSRGERLQGEERRVLVKVGRCYWRTPYFFQAFTREELEVSRKVVDITRQTLIFRAGSGSGPDSGGEGEEGEEEEYAMAEWVVEDSEETGELIITGIRLTAKSATSSTPYIRICYFDASTLQLSSSDPVQTISEGGLYSYTPSTSYILPSPSEEKISFSLDEHLSQHWREARKDFKTKTTPSLPVILKEATDPPLGANGKIFTEFSDYFTGGISVFNKHLPSSPNPVSISSVDVSYRLVGESEYTPVKSFRMTDGSQLPVTVDPRQTWHMPFEIQVPRSPEDAKLSVRWWNRAFVARARPIRFRFVFRDVEDNEASLVVEHVVKHYELDKLKPEEDLAYFYVDDPVLWERRGMHVAKRKEGWDDERVVVKIGGKEVRGLQLTKIVYRALYSDETEVDMGIGEDKDGWRWKCWALVDRSCRRVYAFKVLVMLGDGEGVRAACLGYVLCPEYGDTVEEIRPVMYADEHVLFPEVEEDEVDEAVWEDGIDDVVEEPVPPPPAAATTAGGSASVPAEISDRLASIDRNLERIAGAFESLLEIMRSQQMQGQGRRDVTASGDLAPTSTHNMREVLLIRTEK
ncbi:hypothetical protein V5O48_007691 [Marasmius crinis-equi]|uniref:Thioredoxin domain-containing protein n=1 Tax=Marasmius crinis-equi TaxID=585013 RepID=A0ABR3FFY1_9AGAR